MNFNYQIIKFLNLSMIDCINLTHYYGKRCIYENLSFSVPRGRILGLLGKNGTGKTTTINILSGFLNPRSGECRIFGQNIIDMNPELRRDIGLLIEGHVQYSFMTIRQIERFYARFYPKWDKNVYYDLMSMLKVAPNQRISRMSCGQRSQVALGLLMAQNPQVLILDDFSLGLDPGYRRLFIDYLRDFVKSSERTVFLTSHIIQDMEKLIDDCIIMDYGKILLQIPVNELLEKYRQYNLKLTDNSDLSGIEDIFHPMAMRGNVEFGSFLEMDKLQSLLQSKGIKYENLTSQKVNLEDAFIGLTGKY